jgi:hypothetical protein
MIIASFNTKGSALLRGESRKLAGRTTFRIENLFKGGFTLPIVNE